MAQRTLDAEADTDSVARDDRRDVGLPPPATAEARPRQVARPRRRLGPLVDLHRF